MSTDWYMTRICLFWHHACHTSDSIKGYDMFILGQQLLLHPFNSLFSRITWVSQYLKGKTSLNLNEARDGGVFGRQWHQLDHLHIAPDNYSNTPSLNFSRRVIFLTPNHVKALKGMSKHDRLTEIIYSYNHSGASMPKGFANRFLRNPSDLAHCDCLLITCQLQN